MSDEHTSLLFELFHSEIISYVNSKDENNRGKTISKLESIGYRVGYSLAEQLTKDHLPRFKDDLEIVKFICRDFWISLYQKQMDNLRTNHNGVYVLLDKNFKLFTHVSAGKQFIEHSSLFLAIPCGYIRGVLANLGVNSIVTAEVSNFPSVKFQIMIEQTTS